MKQAILITGYKEIHSLIEIINFFDNSFNFYVHIDKKSKLDTTGFKTFDNAFVSSKFNVNWGGVNHLKAILSLSEVALANPENSFFHLITGEDYPVAGLDYFNTLDFSKNYLQYLDMPAPCWSGNGGMDRIDYYNFYDIFNARTPRGYRMLERLLCYQKKFNIKRRYSKDFKKLQLYSGSTYWSLNRDALEYVINFTFQNKKFMERFKHTFCAEEIYFHTIMLQSPFADSIVNDNLRYIDWQNGPGGWSPAFLDETSFEKIISSNNLFARKLDSRSQKLKNKLKTYLQKEDA